MPSRSGERSESWDHHPGAFHQHPAAGQGRLDSTFVKIVSVVGARPQFVKLAPIAKAAAAASVDHVIVHTGQHYDPMLSDVFFDDLGIAAPDVHLGVGSGSHGVQTGAMLGALDAVFDEHRPDWVLAYGDTNSTVAAALSAVKLHIPVAHLEAGLRSFNRRMPEEHNRVLTDHAADLLLAPTQVAVDHLAAEGLAERTILVGDVMTDVLFEVREAIAQRPSLLVEELGLEPEGFYISTIHRAENTDDPARLAEVVDGLAGLDKPVILLAHPRVVAKASAHGISLTQGSLVEHPPVAYPDLGRGARERRRGDRLGRPAEGSVPPPCAVHDRAKRDRMGRDDRARLERSRELAGTDLRRCGAACAGADGCRAIRRRARRGARHRRSRRASCSRVVNLRAMARRP